MLTKVRKRDGRIVDFNRTNIESAIRKAARATNTNLDVITATNFVIKTIETNFIDKTPSVEDVQDIVEKTLIHFDCPEAAKAYILYRKKQNDEREGKFLVNVVSLVEDYINNKDWRIKENANTTYSVSGLMFHISSSVVAKYSLNKYPKYISDAHINGDIHIHDLSFGLITSYCGGFDLEKLFIEGINKIPGKTSSNPANHLTTATWQMINFIGTLQNENAGAIAFNDISILLAPFIKKDGLNYKQVKQAIQGLVFNLNVPSRWANQCVSEDTEALTENGWKKYNEIKNEKIATYNINNGKIEYLRPEKINIYDYNDKLINLKNRTQDQLVTPNHRVVRRVFNSNKFDFVEAKDLFEYKTPINIPLSGETTNTKEIDENIVMLIAWLVSEGCFSGSRGRIDLFQSIKNDKNVKEIRKILRNLNLTWNEHESITGFAKFPVIRFRLNQRETEFVRTFINEKEIPCFIKELSKEQIKLFINTYVKGDGNIERKTLSSSGGRIRIYTKNKNIKDSLQELCVLCGYGSTIYLRKQKPNDIWVINIIRNPIASITNVNYVNYKGKVWCPTTKNGTFVARRNCKVFITGNSPFSNVTLNWTVPGKYKDDIPMIGGKSMDFSYADLETEMHMINKAFMDVLIEGDSTGSPMTFPIPTVNITDSFDWYGPNTDELFDVTAKYGSFYFANLMNSGIKEDDIYSMCCRLRLSMSELRNKTGGLFGSGINTGSVGVCTLNLPIYAKQSKDEKTIFEYIDKNLEISRDALEIKRTAINKNLERGLMPYTKRFVGTYDNHFSTIGIIGMHELLMNYMGVGIWNKDAHNLAMKIMNHIRGRLIEFQKETNNLYNLEATPAEGASRRLAAISVKRYPDIITANNEERKKGAPAYFTNSIHLPVNYTNDLFESLDLEEPLLTKFTGGCVKHIYLGERLPSAESARNLVRKVCSNYKVPYISITPNFSVCPVHHYINGVHKTCPKDV